MDFHLIRKVMKGWKRYDKVVSISVAVGKPTGRPKHARVLQTGSHVQDSRKEPNEECRAMKVPHRPGALDHPNTSRYKPEQRNRRFAKAGRPGHSESQKQPHAHSRGKHQDDAEEPDGNPCSGSDAQHLTRRK